MPSVVVCLLKAWVSLNALVSVLSLIVFSIRIEAFFLRCFVVKMACIN